jgi:hypothetical protein
MVQVLWIDDQHEEEAMKQLLISAANEGIRLNGYSSYEEGFDVLEKNLDRFDCILLDGMFFKKKDQEQGTEDTTGIGAAISHINRLTQKKAFPWFVLSGKDKFTSGENDLLKANEALCFDKSSLEDLDKLFDEIKRVSENLETFQIRKKYEDVLEVCEDRFLGQDQFSRIYNVLERIENGSSIEGQLTEMRMVIERMFERMASLGLVPDELSPNQASRFLSNRHSDFTHQTDFIHSIFAENVFRLLTVLQDGSHDKEGLNLKVQEYLRTGSSQYFQQSIAFLFLDVLSGFLTLVKSYPNKEQNISLWKRSENGDKPQHEGSIIQMAYNGFITLQDSTSDEHISFPGHVVSKEVLSSLKMETEVYYQYKEQANGKKHVTDIQIKN